MTSTFNREGACPVCAGSMKRAYHDWLFRCSGCGLLGSNLAPQIKTATSENNIDEADRNLGLSAVRTLNNKAILDAVSLQSPPGRRLLDVGSGPGFFLRDAAGFGFDVTGIEPDGNVIETARTGGVDVKHGFFPNCLAADEAFDVMVFNDVLEHIPDVAATLDAARHHLSSQGLLVLNCPDRKGVFYRLGSLLDRLGFSAPFQRMWQMGCPSPHVWYFSESDLVTLGHKRALGLAAKVELKSLTFSGLRERIFHIRDQSRIAGFASLCGAIVLVPFLSILPNDQSAVILRKI